MMEWLEEIRSALDREYAGAPGVMILSTVDRSGWPHARTVVCRRIDDEGRIFAASDARSDKNAQLRGDRRVEAVFWLSRQRLQFRITGEAQLLAFPEDETTRKQIWREMSDESRSLFFWPTPGIAAATDDAFAEAVAADVPPPKNFEVLILEPRQVDRLSLDSHPHRRRVWRSDTKWSGVDINP